MEPEVTPVPVVTNTTQPQQTNVQGLIIALLISVAIAGIRALQFDAAGHFHGFSLDSLMRDGGVTAAVGALIGFITRRKVVIGGQGFPGTSLLDILEGKKSQP